MCVSFFLLASKYAEPKPEDQIQLSKNRYVTVSEFHSKVRVDVREFYVTPDGERRPGKKGISLSLEEWTVLKDNFDKIDNIAKRLSGEPVDDDSEDDDDDDKEEEEQEKKKKNKSKKEAKTKSKKEAKKLSSDSDSD